MLDAATTPCHTTTVLDAITYADEPALTPDGMPPDTLTTTPTTHHLDTASDLVDLLTALHPRHQRTAAAVIYGDAFTQRELHALRTAARAWAKEQAQ